MVKSESSGKTQTEKGSLYAKLENLDRFVHHENRALPRESRLRKAALILLAAATAAFFVCAPAGAVAPAPPRINPVPPAIRIVSKTNDQHLMDATTTDVFVQTNVNFSKVEWSVNGTALSTTIGPGTTSQITYNFSNARQGSVLRFKATPYKNDANGNEVAGKSATIEITAVKAISSVSMELLKSNAVVGEQIDLRAVSNVPYHTMEWYLGDSKTPIASAASRFAGDRHACATYTFEEGQGSSAENGKKHVIKAVAHAIDPSGDTPTLWGNVKAPPGEPSVSGVKVESAGSSIFVHEGKGKICNTANVWIYSIDIAADGTSCDVSWWHEVHYYNDVPGAEPRVYDNDDEGAHAKLYAWVKMFEWDEQGNRVDSWGFFAGAEKGIEGEEHLYLGLDVKYSGYANDSYTETIGNWVDHDNNGVKETFEPKRLTKNHEYRFLGNTSLVDADDLVNRKGNIEINWAEIRGAGLMHRSDRRKYIGDPDDAPGRVDPGAVWKDGWNSVAGSTGAFQEW